MSSGMVIVCGYRSVDELSDEVRNRVVMTQDDDIPIHANHTCRIEETDPPFNSGLASGS